MSRIHSSAVRSAPTVDEPEIRVLRVVTRLNIGGPAHEIAPLCRDAIAHGVRTLLVAGSAEPCEGDRLATIDLGTAARIHVDDLGRAFRPGRDWRALGALRGIIRDFRPDVIHTHTSKAGLLGRWAAPPGVVLCHTFHGTVFDGHFGRVRSAIIARVESALASRTDAIIALGPRIARQLASRGLKRVHVIPPGFDRERLARFAAADRLASRDALGLDGRTIVVAAVGRIARVKGLDVLIAALARTRSPLVLLLAGDGPGRSALERRVKRASLDGRVRFLGWRNDPETVVAAADIVALPSWSEGYPHSLVEAMAAGRATIASAVGEVPALLGSGRGRLIAPGSVASLAGELDHLAADASVRRRLGEAASAFSSRPTEAMVRDTCALYRRLLHPVETVRG